MQTMQAVIMGAFQGLTEFLPVSSSGHIVLTSALYKLFTGAEINVVSNEEVFFDILIHLASLFAVLIYFYKKIKKIFLGFFNSIFNKNFNSDEFRLGIYIISATMVTGVFGLLIKDFAHKLTENPLIVSLLLIMTGLILFLSEKFKRNEKPLTLKKALIIGLFQGFAICPGLSRSGMTISSAVFMGIDRVKSAEFSFILSIPIIALASLIYPLISFDLSEVKTFNTGAMLLGMAVSFVVGFLCISSFMKFLEKRNLKIFAYYCIIAGAVGAIIFGFLK